MEGFDIWKNKPRFHIIFNVCAAFKSEYINPLTPELDLSAQRCMTRFFTGNFDSWTVHSFNICMKNQQMQQLFIQFINNVW
jgi:hypothetical protein